MERVERYAFLENHVNHRFFSGITTGAVAHLIDFVIIKLAPHRDARREFD